MILTRPDSLKAEYTIPTAFDLAAKGLTSERDARIALRDAVVEGRLLPRIVTGIKDLLTPDGEELIDREIGGLWDEELGT